MHSEAALPATAQRSTSGDPPKSAQLIWMACAAHRAARELHLISRDFRHLGEHVRSIEDLLRGRDGTGAPSERETAPPAHVAGSELGAELGCIAHAIDAAATRLGIYRMPSPHSHLEPVAARLARLCGATAEAVTTAFGDTPRDQSRAALDRIARLKAETLAALRCAADDLSEGPDRDPLSRIMWQEIYDRIHLAARKCEAVAGILRARTAGTNGGL